MTTLGDDAAKPWGIDNIEFLISANPGQAPQSLAKIASGGELSRMSLSIQVIASDGSAIPTMVFDEVDSGVGGGSAAAWPRWSAADCRNLAPTGRFYA
jgi:DNA repair protein RecN (Recombination protein N)